LEQVLGEGFSLIEEVYSLEKDPVLFANKLDDSSFIYSEKDGGHLYLSLINGRYSESWIPLKIKLVDLKEKPDCESLKEIIKKWKVAREKVVNLYAYYYDDKLEYTFGESLIDLELSYLENTGNEDQYKRELIHNRYQKILSKTKELIPQSTSKETFFYKWERVSKNAFTDAHENIDYCRNKTLLVEALSESCTNCVGQTSLILSLFIDANIKVPQGWELSVQLFKDHIRPVLYNQTSGKVFDLVYASMDTKRAVIAPWKSLIISLLSGYDFLIARSEFDVLKNEKINYLHKDLMSFKGIDLGYLTRKQIYDLSIFKSSGYFGTGTPPENADMENTIGNRPSSYEDKPNIISDFFGKISNSLGLKSKNKNYYLMDLAKKLKSLMNKNPNLLNAIEKENIRKFDKSEITAYELLEPYKKSHILNGLNDNTFHYPLVSNTHFPSTKYINFYSLERTFISDPQLLENYESVINGFAMLSLPEKFIEIIKHTSLQLDTIANFYKENAFNTHNLKESILFQHQNKDKLSKFFHMFSTYHILIASLIPSASSTEKNKYLMENQNTIRAVVSYFIYISKHPNLFIKKLNELSLEYNTKIDLFLNDDKRYYLFIAKSSISREMSSTSYLKYKFNEHRSIIGLDHWSYYEVFNNLLYNDQYFFTSPLSEDEQEALSSQKKKTISIENIHIPNLGPSEINLPVLNVAPCEKNENGMVSRGLVFINCSRPSKDELKRDEMKTYEALAQTQSLFAEKVLENTSKSMPKDQRPVVILEVNTWKSIINNFFTLGHFTSKRKTSLINRLLIGLHYVQNESLKELINNTIAPITTKDSLFLSTKSKKNRFLYDRKRGLSYIMSLDELKKSYIQSIIQSIERPKSNWNILSTPVPVSINESIKGSQNGVFDK
jgi:hypothetical protein